MLRELWAYIRITWAMIRELTLETKLIKHRSKMVDTYISVNKEFAGRRFTMDNVRHEFDQLESRIKNRFR
jgi:hypothetical protein